MSSQIVKDKAREISYALIKVSFYVKRGDLRWRIENLAFELLENAVKVSVDNSLENLNKALASIAILDSLVRLGYSIYEIEPVNANILIRELDALNTAIRQYGKLEEQLPNLENMFSSIQSNRDTNPASNNMDRKSEENSGPRFLDLNVLEGVQSDIKATAVTTDVRTNGNGINTAIRQSAIMNRIRSGNGDGCRLKDLIFEFPDVSERTLRYDLQRLCEHGVIERVGNGGPASYYKIVSA